MKNESTSVSILWKRSIESVLLIYLNYGIFQQLYFKNFRSTF
ncbi:hypothetical protein LEP1GSC172_1211 [Leptospira noguchii]|uniref:Uncharacterized protein n=1 Tax=Leptospira noguchii TaxID=28182 RepID=M6VKZ5_9LEPT|nr:hypothetical protein LEP1GSC172_1211 [Leptospira noguchii]